jgi:protein TonB
MNVQLGSLTKVIFVAFLSVAVLSQTASQPSKKCTPPTPTYNPDPRPSHYPSSNVGSVTIGVLVDESGQVRDPKIVKSSGSSDFDNDAVDTVRKWKFKPSICDGKPTPVHINLKIDSRVM